MEEENTMLREFRPRSTVAKISATLLGGRLGGRGEVFLLSHLLFLQAFLPERCFAIFSNGVLAIWKNRETFSSSLRPSVSPCL